MIISSSLEKNHLGGQILYRSLDPSKKRRQKSVREKKYENFPTPNLSHENRLFQHWHFGLIDTRCHKMCRSPFFDTGRTLRKNYQCQNSFFSREISWYLFSISHFFFSQISQNAGFGISYRHENRGEISWQGHFLYFCHVIGHLISVGKYSNFFPTLFWNYFYG